MKDEIKITGNDQKVPFMCPREILDDLNFFF
jgi:hypothetical protein